MGTTIVKRGQRYNGLAAQGEQVLAFARRVLSDFENLRQDLKNHGSESVGTLRIGVIPSAGTAAAAQTGPFHKLHPNVHLKVIELKPADVQRALDDFAVDLAITYIGEPQAAQRTRPLFVEGFALLARNGSVAQPAKSLSWRHASRLTLCMLTADVVPSGPMLRQLLQGDSVPGPPLETNSVSALVAHVRTGSWAAVLPRMLAADLKTAELECFTLPAVPDSLEVGVVIPDREFTVPLAEAFFASVRA